MTWFAPLAAGGSQPLDKAAHLRTSGIPSPPSEAEATGDYLADRLAAVLNRIVLAY